ncbi:hypothetical protein [Clostridium beijerinckii]|uniref:hypothetical protein n=1 Tax=Clostridium beijerinckii TaxID=1520 RepID=UPI00156F324F|nr:hypothetical protein [Clostridium beijerinckii]NRT72071.1 hypothetical protein [Clostridium beijerinckii]
MGLKSMLKNKELKEILKPILPTKFTFSTNLGWNIEAFSKHYKLLVTNQLTDKSDAKLVGIAFDYMARFIIANHIEINKKRALENMVCEKGFELLNNVLEGYIFDIEKRLYEDKIKRIENYILNCSNDDYDNIILDVLTISRFEQIYRCRTEYIIPIIEDARIKDFELRED